MHHAHRCFLVPVSTGTPPGKATRPSLRWNGVRPKPQRQDHSHRRGRDRGPGGGSTPLEGGPDGAREVSLPGSARRSRGRRRRSTRRPGVGGSQFMTTIVFVKYGAHHPLNRQRDRYAGEGVDLSLSTLADQVGTCAVALRGRCTTRSPPTCWRRSTCKATARRCRFSLKARPDTGRAWVNVRDDAPFVGAVPLSDRPSRPISRAPDRRRTTRATDLHPSCL